MLLLIFLRFRKEPVETVHIEPIDDAELAEINKEVTDLMDDAAATQTSSSKMSEREKRRKKRAMIKSQLKKKPLKKKNN